ncbi:MAG: nucleoside kinase [Acidobacteria bacterium]|nr:nucleoside kinase [Acidobacteriota bacterium]
MNQLPLMEITLNDNWRIKVKKGLNILQILEKLDKVSPLPVVAAKINNRLTNLRHKISLDSRIEFIDCAHPEGYRVYQSSLSYLAAMAVSRVFPNAALKVEHSLSKGLYCEVLKDTVLTEEELGQIEREMREIVDQDLPVDKVKTYLDEALLFFQETNQQDKVRLFRYSNPHTVDIYYCEEYQNFSDCPLVPSTGSLNLFKLYYYHNGFILTMPEPYTDWAEPSVVTAATAVPEFSEQPKLFKMFQEYGRWLKILGLEDVGALNECVVAGKHEEIIRLSEALQEKKIARIADGVSTSRIILVAGPSSSGKTTFSKRLADQLRVNGLESIVISLDDYFLDRVKTPRDAAGNYDFESLRALDVGLLHEHFAALLAGEAVNVPRYSFHKGCRVPETREIRPHAHTVLLFEGIHAINPELYQGLPSDRISRVYVSPLTTLSMDSHNRIPTTDVRLLRRIVRDNLFRNYSALETLQRWQSVRHGETKYIFPYQKDADFFFNSAMVYELAVLKRFAEPLLYRISIEHPEYSEARRLLKFLSYFQDISPDHVPSTSLLREFIGKSGFVY